MDAEQYQAILLRVSLQRLVLKHHATREKTFRAWPKQEVVSAAKLAGAGFYYLGREDRVRCAFCGIILRSWDPGDEPMDQHERLSPTCSVVTGGLPDDCEALVSSSVAAHGVHAGTLLKREDLRLKTFQHWPKTEDVSPVKLAKAGFYYLGENDRVKCVFCDSVLRDWEPGDEPMEQHRRLEPTCRFVLGVANAGNIPMTTSFVSSAVHRTVALQGEVDRLRDQLKCKVCWDADACVVFDKCNHMVCCEACAANVKKCPMCRAAITKKKRVFTG